MGLTAALTELLSDDEFLKEENMAFLVEFARLLVF